MDHSRNVGKKKHGERNVGQQLQNIGKEVQQGWGKISTELSLPLAIGGIYPLSHFTFEVDGVDHSELKAYYIQEMLKKGFLASNIFYAMYAHSSDHVQQYLSATKEVFSVIKSIIAVGNGIHEHLDGKPSAFGFKKMT